MIRQNDESNIILTDDRDKVSNGNRTIRYISAGRSAPFLKDKLMQT